ncbi:Protein HASTY 1 [Hibiscus syriacus]|uniref:Protein HASTY 1 n=1 Tax=Hibiscus syriacus TaxID=106335 RepID=A0A6A2YKS6_HIBSY|nr:protein HASTY 1-like isoform X1 [Hibiscus syriacus]KAE8679297.1 Protein HASTY 1 [Hibiscus syriacus]
MDEGNNDNSIVNNVARAIVAALDWNSTPDARKAASFYLESIKAGDIRVLVNTSFLLVKKDWSSEIRLHAFKMLQHVVRFRWEEFGPSEHRNFANAAFDLMSEIADTCEEWALKSQTAALVAEIVRREFVNLWQELLPSLVSLSSKGHVQAELVSMMLRWLPEDITVHNEDLEGDRRRLLLRGLTQSLPEILPLLFTLLERHYGAAMNELGRQQLDIAKQHAAAVTATLNAVNAYAEWAPLSDLAKYGIIHGCCFLLSSPDFRLHACEFFKLVSPRKRPTDDSASDFDSAMSNIFQILMNVSQDFLVRSSSAGAAIDENDYEFAEYVCESMVSLGSSNLQCVLGDSATFSLYLQKMLGFFQHFKLALHNQSLQFWLALMRDSMSKPKLSVHSSGDGSTATNADFTLAQVDDGKRKILTFLNDNICSTILDISFQRMLRKEKLVTGTTLSLGVLELWSDDFEDKGDFGSYRSRLLELIKLIASNKPLVAAAKVSERIIMIIRNLLNSPMPVQDLAVMESMQMALENVVSSIFDGSNQFPGGSSEVHSALCRIFEDLLRELLSLNWTEPALVEVLGHYLDAMGPFLKYFPNAVASVINKLFELLNSLPFIVKDPSTSSTRHARLQICTSFIRIAKAADKSVLPHMKGIADTMAHLQREGRLLRGEHNLLGEAFLVMASAAGSQQQQEVLAWLLEPMSQQWIQIEWQNNYLSEPLGLVRLCSERAFMWSLFHTVTFFEKALKRSGMRKGNLNLQKSSTENSTPHPIASHLSWMLPPLLKLLRGMHSLWSPSVFQMLPGEIKAAMSMSDVERSSLLGGGNLKSLKGTLTFVDGPQFDVNKEGYTEPNEADIRNWLKGIRDSGYNVLGLSTTIGDPFFKCMDVDSVALTLIENIQSMEFRHIRQLVHSILIPLVKSCPPDMWEIWLQKLLHPLFVHCHQALSCSWSGLLHEGRAKVPDNHGILTGSDLKVEVMEEKLLRDLTREICLLLSTIASPGLNASLPSLEHSGHVGRIDTSSLKDLDAFASGSMVGFLLKHKSLAIPMLQISLEAFSWTDSEAVTKACSFSAAVVLLAIFTNNADLQEFVSRDLFSAAIRGLALESNAFISADLVNLCREIFIYLCDRKPAPRQILLSLPCISSNDLHALEEALTKTASPKEQKQHMKSFLLLATGNNLKALAAQKSVNIITNVTARPRSSLNAPENRIDEGETVGLAAIL